MNLLNFFKKHIFIAHLLLAFAIVAILITVLLFWLDTYTNHGEAVDVPDVRGLSLENAAPAFQAKELNFLIVDSFFVKNAPPGTIIETRPPVGNSVKKGRTIYLTINSFSTQLLQIPDVMDMSQRQALAILKSIGFESVREKMVSSAFRDLVVGLEMEERPLSAGDKIPSNSNLTLLVGSGTEAIIFEEEKGEEDIIEITEEETWN